MRRARLLCVALVLAIGPACAPRLPHAKRSWQLRGTVVETTDRSLEVRHKSGRVVTLEIDAATEYFVNRHPDTHEAIHVGTRVTVDVEWSPGAGDRAKRVQVFGR